MRRLLLASSVLALASGTAPVATAQVAPGTARYLTTVSVQGMELPMQTVKTTTARDGGGWRVVSATALPDFVGGGAIGDTMDVGADLRPVARRMASQTPMGTMRAVLDYTATRLTGTTTSGGPARTVDLDLSGEPVHTAQTVDLLLQTLPLSDGFATRLRLYNAESDAAVGEAALAVVGKETLAVPAGTFEAWKTTLTRDGQTQTFWVEAAAPHRLLRMQSALEGGQGTITQVFEN